MTKPTSKEIKSLIIKHWPFVHDDKGRFCLSKIADIAPDDFKLITRYRGESNSMISQLVRGLKDGGLLPLNGSVTPTQALVVAPKTTLNEVRSAARYIVENNAAQAKSFNREAALHQFPKQMEIIDSYYKKEVSIYGLFGHVRKKCKRLKGFSEWLKLANVTPKPHLLQRRRLISALTAASMSEQLSRRSTQ